MLSIPSLDEPLVLLRMPDIPLLQAHARHPEIIQFLAKLFIEELALPHHAKCRAHRPDGEERDQ